MTDGLKARHRAAIIAALAANDRVERAVLFGSRAMSANTITSDVDIALFGQHLTLTDQASLAAACEELPMAQSVDLVLHSAIDNPALVEHIRSYGVEWYRRGGGVAQADHEASHGFAQAAAGWKATSWGQIANLEYGKGLRDYKNNTGKFTVYGTNGAVGTCDEYLCNRPGVIIGRKGAYRGVHYSNKPFYVIDTAYWLNHSKDVDTKYAYYELLNQDINSLDSGSAIPSTSKESFYSLSVFLPPLEEQKAIAHVLGTLDDKIELNRRMNETLEAMARALFKDWFVDFGPVRAKAEGRREAYLPEEVWGLFPDSFEDSELGEIPRGWGVKPLSEVATFLNGLALQKYPATSPEDSLPVIKIAELRNGISAKTDKASRNIPKKYIVTDGDFLFSWSGSLMAEFWTEGEGALNQHLFKVTSDQYPPWFFAGWVQFHLDGFQRIAASKATTMGHIQRSHLQAALASCPPDDAVAGLGAVIEPLVRRGVSARVESRSLAKIRDRLLPNLMSGGIRVREGEKVMEVAS